MKSKTYCFFQVKTDGEGVGRERQSDERAEAAAFA